MKIKKIITLFTIFLGVASLTAACSQKRTQKDSGIKIVTSTNVYSDIAKNIVGKYGSSSSIIKSGDIDPHDFEPTTKSATEVAKADIVVSNGLGYDKWMDNLAKSNNKPLTRVGNDLLKNKTGQNPHIWYDLQMPKKYVNYLVKELSKISPKHKKYFKANAKAYLAKIQKIQDLALKIKSKTKKPVFVSEPVFDYALVASGFQIGNKEFEKATESGTDPSAKAIEKMNMAINKKKIAFFVNNTQASSSTVNSLLKKVKAKKIPVINVRETMPNGISYYQWMKDNYQKLASVSE